MAKPLTSSQIEALIQATKNADRLTRLQVFTLATSGLVDVEDGAFIITSKGNMAIKRQVRSQTGITSRSSGSAGQLLRWWLHRQLMLRQLRSMWSSRPDREVPARGESPGSVASTLQQCKRGCKRV